MQKFSSTESEAPKNAPANQNTAIKAKTKTMKFNSSSGENDPKNVNVKKNATPKKDDSSDIDSSDNGYSKITTPVIAKQFGKI